MKKRGEISKLCCAKEGYAAMVTTFIIVVVSLTVVSSFAFFAAKEVAVTRTYSKSVESYYTAESGIEDATYRIVSGKQLTSPETLSVGGNQTTITVTSNGSQRLIRSEGQKDTTEQHVESRVDITTAGVNFAYGAQVGDGGLVMMNNSRVVGSVYSGGNIQGSAGATITGDAIVSAGTPPVVDQQWIVQNQDYAAGTSSGNVATVIDAGGDVGSYNSIALGLDGFARVSYYDTTNNDLKYIRCTTADCSGKVTTVVDSAGDVGYRYTSIQVASDGFARISYYDASNKDLKFARCLDDNCTSKNLTVIDGASPSRDIGQFSSMVLGPDQFGRISYYTVSNGDLKFARCLDADCATKNITTIDSTGDVGKYTSIVLGSDGFARISYQDETNDDLKYTRCTNADCSSVTITTVDSAGDVGSLKSGIGLGQDGFAQISYFDDTNDDLKFVHCTNADCTTKNITTVDASGTVGKYNDLSMGGDGFARMSFYRSGNLGFVRCTNEDCTTKVVTTSDNTSNDIGHYTSIALGADGFGRMSHYDDGADDLRYVLCIDIDCTSGVSQIDVAQSFQPAVSDTIRSAELYLKKVGNPANALVTLIRDSGGSPSANQNDILATATLAAASVGGAYGWMSVSFSNTPALIANTTYWLMIDTSLDNANYFVWGGDAPGGYTRGLAKRSSSWTAGGWTSLGADLDFKTYMGGTDTRIDGVTVEGDAKAHVMDTVTVNRDAYGYTLSNITVGRNVFANSLSTCTITGNASYNSATGCTINGSQTTPTTPPADSPDIPLPITDAIINGWKNDALLGGIIPGNYAPTGCTITLGPKKIEGNFTLNASCPGGQLITIAGTVWVTGTVDISNNARIQLVSSYGSLSGVIVADGTIHLSNNGIFSGSGTPGSYLMLLTTAAGGGHHGSAIDLHNNANGAIFYAQNGQIYLHQRVEVTELVGYAIHLENNATLTYEVGLQNVRFSSGPSGGYDVRYWRRVE